MLGGVVGRRKPASNDRRGQSRNSLPVSRSGYRPEMTLPLTLNKTRIKKRLTLFVIAQFLE